MRAVVDAFGVYRYRDRARFGREAATHARDVAASGLLRDVLVAYWELAYDTSAYEVQRQSRDLAEQQLADANERARLGLIAHADVLQFATELASLEEQVAQADSARQSQAIELGRLLGLPPAVAVQMQVRDAPARFALPDESAEGWVRRALLASDQLLQLEANAADARDQIRAAANAALAKLDLTAWVSLDGLGDKDAARPYRQIGEASALSAFVGLDLELPVVNTERRAQLAQTRATSAAADAPSVPVATFTRPSSSACKSSTALRIASGTERAFPMPTPMRPLLSPTTTVTRKANRRAPLTTLATRVISMMRSSNSLAVWKFCRL